MNVTKETATTLEDKQKIIDLFVDNFHQGTNWTSFSKQLPEFINTSLLDDNVDPPILKKIYMKKQNDGTTKKINTLINNSILTDFKNMIPPPVSKEPVLPPLSVSDNTITQNHKKKPRKTLKELIQKKKKSLELNPFGLVDLVLEEAEDPDVKEIRRKKIETFNNRSQKTRLIENIDIAINSYDNKLFYLDLILKEIKKDIEEKKVDDTFELYYRKTNNELKDDPEYLDIYPFLSEDGNDTTELEKEIENLNKRKAELEVKKKEIEHDKREDIPLILEKDNNSNYYTLINKNPTQENPTQYITDNKEYKLVTHENGRHSVILVEKKGGRHKRRNTKKNTRRNRRKSVRRRR